MQMCIRDRDSTGDPWIKDGGDHSVTFPSDQKAVSYTHLDVYKRQGYSTWIC